MNLSTLLPGPAPRSIPNISVLAGLKILVLAPHPDDFDAIGVTLKQLSNNGNQIHVAIAPTGSGVEDAYCPSFTLAQKTDLRKDEQRQSLQFFGLPEDCFTFLSLSNDAEEDQPLDNSENADVILTLMHREPPDIVFLPHWNDTNNGHKAMYALFEQAILQLGIPLAAFLIRDPKTIWMRTDLYMPFGQDTANWKAKLLRFHDSQHQRNLRTRGHGFDERILAVNREIARDLALADEYAEAFEVELYNHQSNELR
jgi:LmbE family N-acetylglucosaminyl deacetylase